MLTLLIISDDFTGALDIQNIVNNNEQFRSETEEYNFQKPFVLSVDDTTAQLQEQKDHFMSYADLIQGKK